MTKQIDRKQAWILAIGNELLNGDILDRNSNYLQKELLEYSIEVQRVLVLPDDLEIIIQELNRGVKEADYLFITGGLGPTEDDQTRYALSKAFHLPLVQDKEDLKRIERKFLSFGRKMSPSNERQSFYPKGARVFPNERGTASAFHIRESEQALDTNIFVFPGVHREMCFLLQDQVLLFIRENLLSSIIVARDRLLIRILGMGESVVDERVKQNIFPHNPIRWEITTRLEGIVLKFYLDSSKLGTNAVSKNPKNWKNNLKEDLNHEFSSWVYSWDEKEDMNGVLARLLREKNYRLALAESCTGGAIGKYITDQAGSSEYFAGGVIAYHSQVKRELLGVSLEEIRHYGEVSLEVAEAMAKGGRKSLCADFCLSVTGIAGPGGASFEKPVGTVCFGVAGPGGEIFSSKRIFHGDRNEIRFRSLFYGLNLLRLFLEERFSFLKEHFLDRSSF